MKEQLATVSKVFWPRDMAAAASRIIPCSSLMGLSARALLDMKGKPPFENFWDESRKGVAHAVSSLPLEPRPPLTLTTSVRRKFWVLASLNNTILTWIRNYGVTN